jgi:hypothetical protein
MRLKWLNNVTLINRQTGQQLYHIITQQFSLAINYYFEYSFFLHAERNLMNSKIDSCVEAKFSKYTKLLIERSVTCPTQWGT